MNSALRALTIIPCLTFLLASCGGGGEDAGDITVPGAATTTVTLYHPSGRVAATGEVLTGTMTKTGVWTEFFDADGSPRQWRRSYVQNTWDTTQDWREWNVEGSIRNDVSDR